MLTRVLVVSCLLAGCGGGSKSGSTEPTPIANQATQGLVTIVPRVDGTDVLAAVHADIGKPDTAEAYMKGVPLLVVVDVAGSYRAAMPPSRWQDLATHRIEPTAPVDLRRLYMTIAEGRGLMLPVADIYANLAAPVTDSGIELNPSSAMDDPPPPEEEDMPDDGEEESGGSGTAMALDEGRMGKRDSDRAEGQYKMRKTPDDPQLAAQMEKERARQAKLEAQGFVRGPRDPLSSSKQPTRQSVVSGFIDPGETLPFQRAAVVAHRDAKASAIVKLLGEGAADSILVAHSSEVRPLRLLFTRDGWEKGRRHWIEVRALGGMFIVEGVPGKEQRTPLALGKLAGAYAALVADTRFGKLAPVDVLVDGQLSAQALVDVLVTLDRAGARSIALGLVPPAGSPQASFRASSLF